MENGTLAGFTQTMQAALTEQTAAYLRVGETFAWEEEITSPNEARATRKPSSGTRPG
ncbi:hypothetical protein [Streptomyces sp. NPDC001070]